MDYLANLAISILCIVITYKIANHRHDKKIRSIEAAFDEIVDIKTRVGELKSAVETSEVLLNRSRKLKKSLQDTKNSVGAVRTQTLLSPPEIARYMELGITVTHKSEMPGMEDVQGHLGNLERILDSDSKDSLTGLVRALKNQVSVTTSALEMSYETMKKTIKKFGPS